jgi:hypothetical protein
LVGGGVPMDTSAAHIEAVSQNFGNAQLRFDRFDVI